VLARPEARASWDEGTYYPLENLQEKQARFQCFDSVLSEEAVLAFEYGYATTNPYELVIWEAQFGDFANGAQVVIDQFIASGEAKWGRACGLVMLMLPHGYEGQGPEHSSARIERYMQLCAEMNMEVCVPTTPAQIFHMLRRQAMRKQRKPLIIITPKSLLRHKDAISTMDELAKGGFQTVIGEVDPSSTPRRSSASFSARQDLLRTAGRIAARTRSPTSRIVRLEQLYPFPQEAFQGELAKYPKATEIVWCQEEPRNQGAWYWIASRQHLDQRSLNTASSASAAGVASGIAASPAVGYYAKHNAQQKALIENAFRRDRGHHRS
jgi:2-oxoglutarate dehydrogenase E1 component